MPAPSDRRRWGTFPTTADMGIRASASTPEGLWEALGLGLYSIITDLRTVRPTERRSVHASGSDVEALAVDFLSRLLLLQQQDGFLLRDLRVTTRPGPPSELDAEVRGEPLDPQRHPRRLEVKAVTFHRLAIDLQRGRARVIVDI